VSRAGAWLLAVLLVLSALAAVGLRPAPSPDESSDSPAISADAAQSVAVDANISETRALESSALQLPWMERQPSAQSAPTLADSTATQKRALALTIRDAGYACPDVLSALALNREGNAWRVSCGDLLLYWIDRDESGRMSVEPGAYDHPGPESGVRTLTIPEPE
jgi:hypothetical protein